MNPHTPLSTVTLLAIVHLALLCGGCFGPQRSAEERLEREFGGAAAGERITAEELDGLTLAFADRYVGLVYSVCHGVKENNPDPAQRRAAQVFLADNAANIYDIASNADPFTRMLDLVVVITLVSQVWDDDGRAVAVFGQRGQKLIDALIRAREESRALAARVLTHDQLEAFDSLLRDWRQENPDMIRASFVRFSNFAIGRNRSAAADVLEPRGFFAEIGEAGQSVDEARLLSRRMFHWLKRAPMLLRWQAAAMKDEAVATPGLDTALDDIHRLTDEIEQLPANVATERRAILETVFWRTCALLVILFVLLILYRLIVFLFLRYRNTTN